MSKRAILLLIAVFCVLTVSVSGTLAYLTGADQVANVTTAGRVNIVQNESKRDAAAKLVPFIPNPPLLPAVYSGDTIPLDEDPSHWPGEGAAWQTLAPNDAVVDHFITVTNEGGEPAYVRTIVALECPAPGAVSLAGSSWIHVHHNAADGQAIQSVEEIDGVRVDETNYHVLVYTYGQPLDVGDTTIPSLKQLYMDKSCTNQEVEAIGNTYQVLALSQAVQTATFQDADTALDTAFGDATSDHLAEWLEAVVKGGSGSGSDGGDDTGDNDNTTGDNDHTGGNDNSDNDTDDSTTGDQPQSPQPVLVSSTTELNEALAQVETNGTIILQLAPGTYKTPANATGKTITLLGSDGVTLQMGTDDKRDGPSDFSFANSALRLEQVHVNAASFGTSEGFACRSLEMVDCTISGNMTLFAPATFTGCAFTTSSPMVYSIEVNGQNTTFTGCTFTVYGKAVLVNNPGDQPCTVQAIGCTLNDRTKGQYETAFAVESSDNAVPYTLVFENCTVTGFKQGTQGIPTNTALWSNRNSIPTTLLHVTVDGQQVY